VWFYPAKKDLWETAGENWALDPARYVACGPFTLKEFNRGVKNLWGLNEKYSGVREVWLTEIREQSMPSGLPAYIAGDIPSYGISQDTPPAEVALINANPVLRAESHPQPSTFTDYLGFNTMPGAYPPIDNPDVRLALCKAIDKETLVGEIYRGFANPAWGILPKGFPGFSGDALKDLDPNKYDPEAAKQLLSKAGFPDGKGFPKFDVWMRQPGQIQLNLLQAIQARWKENLGIEVELKPADFQAFAEVYQGKGEKAAIYYVSYAMDYLDPATFLNVFVTKGGRHPHVDPAWDEKYTSANKLLDSKARLDAITEVEKDLVNSTAYFFTVQPFSISLFPCNLKGWGTQPNKDGYVFANGGYPGCIHAWEGLYWADPACRASAGG
jgi:ABC-type transport system substrate-binding protein